MTKGRKRIILTVLLSVLLSANFFIPAFPALSAGAESMISTAAQLEAAVNSAVQPCAFALSPHYVHASMTLTPAVEIIIEGNGVTCGAGTVFLAGTGGSVTLQNINFSGDSSAAVVVDAAAKTVLKNVHMDARISADGNGGALRFSGSGHVEIYDSVFSNCAVSSPEGAGGAIASENLSGTLIVKNTLFLHNQTAYGQTEISGGAGGAIFLNQVKRDAEIKIQDCYFEGNEAAKDVGSSSAKLADGGAVCIMNVYSGAKVEISGNTFTENVAGDDGGGIFLQTNDSIAAGNLTLANNTFFQNTAQSLQQNEKRHAGGAVALYANGTVISRQIANVDLEHNTFVQNHALAGSDGGALSSFYAGTQNKMQANLKNNLFVENTGGNTFFRTISGVYSDKGGNVGADEEAPALTLEDVFGTAQVMLFAGDAAKAAGNSSMRMKIPTLLPVPESPADNVSADSGLPEDQRGVQRGNPPYDAGAVEISWVKFSANMGEWKEFTAAGYNARGTAYQAAENLCYVVNSGGQTGPVFPENPTLEGFLFGGWSTVQLSPGTLQTRNLQEKELEYDGSELFAVWHSVSEYTVTYAAPGAESGTPPVDSQSPYPSGSSAAVLGGEQLLRRHYRFAGWNTRPDGSGILYAAGESFSVTEDTVLYATWKEDEKGSLAYEKNGAESGNAPEPGLYYFGEAIPVAGHGTLSKANHSFEGWNTRADGSGTAFAPGGTLQITADTTLYAQWNEQEKYTVVYNAGGGLGAIYTEATYNPLYTVLGNDGKLGFSRADHIFMGWSTETEGADIRYTAGERITLSEGILQLYAVWRPVTSAQEYFHYAYVLGYPDGTIRPDQKITREEVAAIFLRILPEETLKASWKTVNGFSDVSGTRWSNHSISTLADMGVILGYPNGKFEPTKNITRAEFATMIVRIAGLEGETAPGNPFADVNGGWAAKYIDLAYANGYIRGYKDGTFLPNRHITRAEAMAMINRVQKRGVAASEDLLPGMQTFTDNKNTKSWYYLDVQEATNSHTVLGAATEAQTAAQKWNRLISTPNWLLLTKQGYDARDLLYPVS